MVHTNPKTPCTYPLEGQILFDMADSIIVLFITIMSNINLL